MASSIHFSISSADTEQPPPVAGVDASFASIPRRGGSELSAGSRGAAGAPARNSARAGCGFRGDSIGEALGSDFWADLGGPAQSGEAAARRLPQKAQLIGCSPRPLPAPVTGCRKSRLGFLESTQRDHGVPAASVVQGG